MRARSNSRLINITQDVDVLNAPMEVAHKHLALKHLQRLRKTLDESDEDAIGRYTTKQAAREQLARMSLVFREYETRARNGEIHETVESMVADIVETSFAVGGKGGTYEQPIFSCPLLLGREQEVAALMQELEAGSADDVIELWNAIPRAEKVLPDHSVVHNIATDIDWTRSLVRSKSEDNIVYHRGPGVAIKDRPKFTRELCQSNFSNWEYTWPPEPAEEQLEGRQRTKINASDWVDLMWLVVSPGGA